MVENHFDDLDPEFVLDEGGSGMRGFFSAGDVFEISVAEKKITRLRLVARAEPGHASQPWAEAATHRLVKAANAMLTQPPEDRDCPPVAEMIKRLGGAPDRTLGVVRKARREIRVEPVDKKSKDSFLLSEPGLESLRYGDLVEYSNHRRRVRGRTVPYEFRSVEQLRYDFEEDVRRAGGSFA